MLSVTSKEIEKALVLFCIEHDINYSVIDNITTPTTPTTPTTQKKKNKTLNEFNFNDTEVKLNIDESNKKIVKFDRFVSKSEYYYITQLLLETKNIKYNSLLKGFECETQKQAKEIAVKYKITGNEREQALKKAWNK